jgi:hypothetical protein
MFFGPTYPNFFAFEAGNRIIIFFWALLVYIHIICKISSIACTHSRLFKLFSKIIFPDEHDEEIQINWWSEKQK